MIGLHISISTVATYNLHYVFCIFTIPRIIYFDAGYTIHLDSSLFNILQETTVHVARKYYGTRICASPHSESSYEHSVAAGCPVF